jgi:hypothetical protein
MIMTPTAASDTAISVVLPNSCSISALGLPRNMTCSISSIRPKPTIPVQRVATHKLRAKGQNAWALEK